MTGHYRYRAATSAGRIVEGELDAATRASALEELRRQQLVPVELSPAAVNGRVRRRGLGREPAVAVFARTIATLLSAGVSLDRAVAFAAGQARHPDVAEAARAVHHDLQGGAGVAEAMAAHPRVFGPVFTAMVAAGEESGALDEAMARVADHQEEVVELRSRIRAALVYPSLMAIATGAGVALLLLFVVPRFAAMILDEGGALPLSTRLLLGVSRLVVGGWWIALLGAGAAVLLSRRWLADADNRIRWDGWRLRWPLAGDLEEKYATARFARALGLLLGHGRPILAALRTAGATVSNAALRARLDRAVDAVSHGQHLSAALAGSLPPLAAELMAVGEESGRLDEMCLRIAETYDGEVRRSLRALVAVIEPALILLFGLIVGFVALAMLQAIYGIRLNPF